MKISLKEVRRKFDQLINNEISREEISEWAIYRQNAADLNQLEYNPPSDEEKLWRSITYLMGVDLKDIDGSYLHSIENFIEFRKKMGI